MHPSKYTRCSILSILDTQTYTAQSLTGWPAAFSPNHFTIYAPAAVVFV